MIESLRTLLDYFKDERHRREARADEALTAIYVATNETMLYMEMLRRKGTTDRSTEENLSRLWAKAAIPIRRLNPDLADRCLLKGRYWINPENWSPDEVASFRIGIAEIFCEVQGLLRQDN